MEPEKPPLRYFLLGSDIAKSISPAVQNVAFNNTGFRGKYELFQIRENEFDTAVNAIEHLKGVGGFNITAPYKERIIPYLSELDSRSRSIGAVNTVKISLDGKMSGYNTDVDGILASLKKLGALKDGKCVILGAGGAARACAYTVLITGYHSLTILNRTLDRAGKLKLEFGTRFPKSAISAKVLNDENLAEETQDCHLLINAVTSPFPVRADFARVSGDLKFLDLGYKSPSSILLSARRARVKCVDGLLMLVEQAASAFEIWTGMKAPTRVMLLAAKRKLSGQVYDASR